MPKRTYQISDKSKDIVDGIKDSNDIPMNKSQFVDRAIKYYYKKMIDGDIDDPMVQSALSGDLDIQVGETSSEERSSRDKLSDKFH